MINFKYFKIIGHILFVITFIFFSTLNAKNLDKFNKADNISNYFSGILLLNQAQYGDSYKYLKKLDGLEKSHSTYSTSLLYSLVNSGNLNQAFNFSKKLEKEGSDSFESDLITGVYYLKNLKFDLSSKYFLRAKKRNSISLLDNYVINSLYFWSNLNNSELEKAALTLANLDERFTNLKKIQNVFLYCFFDSEKTGKLFQELVEDKKIDFSRYNYFYAKYLESIGKNNDTLVIIERSLKKYPRNLLLNQYKLHLDNSEKNFNFDCKRKDHVIAELLYISANALSSQSIVQLSNFYANLAKYLNKDFRAFDILIAENFYNINDFNNAKKIYKKFNNYGSAFKWHANKQISRILIQENNKEASLNLLKKVYEELPSKGIYETFDYAEFLKNNEEFETSIIYFSNILKIITDMHPLYPEVTDSRGVAYERIGDWNKAEKDLTASLKIDPDQAYVINYLAYSWLEQGIKIEKSLEMLKKANRLKSNDPYIIDSLGWALFKLKKYKESKDYLQVAVKLLPSDPTVNDHYGDVLWKNGNKIQARYYWNYVLSLDKTKQELKTKIEKKLIKGL